MRRRLVLLAALSLCACTLSTRGATPPALATAADFSLPSHDGKTVSLSELTSSGPAVLVFYRGYW